MAGSYDIQMIVTSVDGCVDSNTFIDALSVLPLPTSYFTCSPNPVQMFNTQVVFNNGSSNAVNYEWFFDSGEPATSTVTNPRVTFPDGETGEYPVTLVAYSASGCSDTITIDVIVYPEVIIYAPNAFTPDNDEHNQNWRVYTEGIDTYNFELTIYNRWGQCVWESRNPEEAWDGTYNGLIVQSGVYTWVLQATNLWNDNKHTYSGHVSVLK